jgi:voltage-gated potassium channel Kch
VVIGDLEVSRVTCALLTERSVAVTHLLHPSDVALREALDESVDAVAVLVRGDVTALRYALLVEHLRPGVRLVVTIFDRTLSEQLLRVVPNCQISSPADIAVPSIAAACLADGTLAVDVTSAPARRLIREDNELRFIPFGAAHRTRRQVARTLLGRVRAHDDATRILLLGVLGLLVVLVSDWILTATALHRAAGDALFAATRVVTTVGPGDADTHGRTWYVVLASIFMLITIILTAIFTAGVVNRVLSARSLALFGSRVPPRRDHVVIVGLGQVGLRLAIAVRRLGIRVIVVEKDPAVANLRLAKAAGVPVLIGNGEDRKILHRVALHRARALAAMGASDLDNIEVSIAALAVAPQVPVVLRAGEDDVIAETRSLFRIGEVRDVSALTAAAVAHSLAEPQPTAVFAQDHQAVVFDGRREIVVKTPQRCVCAGDT